MTYRIITGDCLAEMPKLLADGVQVDSVVCDSPYEINFMSSSWDRAGVAFNPTTWRQAYDLLKPGGHLIALCGTRTEHRVVCAIEDAGFEIRDRLLWLYGSGFPKSHDVSKAIDRAAGAERTEIIGVRPGHEGFEHRTDRHSAGARREGWDRPWKDDPEAVRALHLQTAPATEAARQWQGWGTALKPAMEIAVLARKPLSESTVAAQVLATGTGALNVDACRVATAGTEADPRGMRRTTNGHDGDGWGHGRGVTGSTAGRWPANVLHSGEREVLDAFARFGERAGEGGTPERGNIFGGVGRAQMWNHGDTGTAARFFPALRFSDDELRFMYCGKADTAERAGTSHPTVKPIALMEWLVRLVTPPGGTVLDPFMGSGSTVIACERLGFDAIGIEQDAKTVAEAEERIKRLRARRLLGNAPRHAPLPGQQSLFADGET